MDLKLKLPLDYREAQWFRRLCPEIGGAVNASFVFLNLWRELGYLACDGNVPGRLTRADSLMLLSELERGGLAAGTCATLMSKLEEVKLLVAMDDGWLCPMFQADNGGMGGQRNQAQRGGDMRSFTMNAQRAAESAFTGSLFMDPALLVDGEGKPLTADEVRRLRYLVHLCDSALFRGERPNFTWGATLIANSLAVVRNYSDEQVMAVCRKLASRRGHPSLAGVTTETLLPQWKNIVAELEF